MNIESYGFVIEDVGIGQGSYLNFVQASRRLAILLGAFSFVVFCCFAFGMFAPITWHTPSEDAHKFSKVSVFI